MQVVLLEGSSMEFILWRSKGIKRKVRKWCYSKDHRSIIHELHSWDIQGDEMEDENGVTRSIIVELHSLDIQGDQMAVESGVTRSMIDELHSSDIQGD